MDAEFRKAIEEAGIEILNKIGVYSQTRYMKVGGEVQSTLSIRTGRLVRSVLGTGGEHIREIKVGENVGVFTIGSKVPYAAIHELGGVRTVTEAMRRYFWWRYKTSGDVKWKYMSRAKSLTFPRREYLMPAINDNYSWISELLRKKVGKGLEILVDRVLVGKAIAQPLPNKS